MIIMIWIFKKIRYVILFSLLGSIYSYSARLNHVYFLAPKSNEQINEIKRATTQPEKSLTDLYETCIQLLQQYRIGANFEYLEKSVQNFNSTVKSMNNIDKMASSYSSQIQTTLLRLFEEEKKSFNTQQDTTEYKIEDVIRTKKNLSVICSLLTDEKLKKKCEENLETFEPLLNKLKLELKVKECRNRLLKSINKNIEDIQFFELRANLIAFINVISENNLFSSDRFIKTAGIIRSCLSRFSNTLETQYKSAFINFLNLEEFINSTKQVYDIFTLITKIFKKKIMYKDKNSPKIPSFKKYFNKSETRKMRKYINLPKMPPFKKYFNKSAPKQMERVLVSAIKLQEKNLINILKSSKDPDDIAHNYAIFNQMSVRAQQIMHIINSFNKSFSDIDLPWEESLVNVYQQVNSIIREYSNIRTHIENIYAKIEATHNLDLLKINLTSELKYFKRGYELEKLLSALHLDNTSNKNLFSIDNFNLLKKFIKEKILAAEVRSEINPKSKNLQTQLQNIYTDATSCTNFINFYLKNELQKLENLIEDFNRNILPFYLLENNFIPKEMRYEITQLNNQVTSLLDTDYQNKLLPRFILYYFLNTLNHMKTYFHNANAEEWDDFFITFENYYSFCEKNPELFVDAEEVENFKNKLSSKKQEIYREILKNTLNQFTGKISELANEGFFQEIHTNLLVIKLIVAYQHCLNHFPDPYGIKELSKERKLDTEKLIMTKKDAQEPDMITLEYQELILKEQMGIFAKSLHQIEKTLFDLIVSQEHDYQNLIDKTDSSQGREQKEADYFITYSLALNVINTMLDELSQNFGFNNIELMSSLSSWHTKTSKEIYKHIEQVFNIINNNESPPVQQPEIAYADSKKESKICSITYHDLINATGFSNLDFFAPLFSKFHQIDRLLDRVKLKYASTYLSSINMEISRQLDEFTNSNKGKLEEIIFVRSSLYNNRYGYEPGRSFIFLNDSDFNLLLKLKENKDYFNEIPAKVWTTLSYKFSKLLLQIIISSMDFRTTINDLNFANKVANLILYTNFTWELTETPNSIIKDSKSAVLCDIWQNKIEKTIELQNITREVYKLNRILGNVLKNKHTILKRLDKEYLLEVTTNNGRIQIRPKIDAIQTISSFLNQNNQIPVKDIAKRLGVPVNTLTFINNHLRNNFSQRFLDQYIRWILQESNEFSETFLSLIYGITKMSSDNLISLIPFFKKYPYKYVERSS